MQLGIDEAGRGCSCGSMFMAGVWAPSEVAESWKLNGLKDSKELSREDRDKLAVQIKEEASLYTIEEVLAEHIDLDNLDHIEFETMNEIISFSSKHDKIIIDCPGNRSVWWKAFSDVLPTMDGIILEHKADENYPIVSAASILAKSARDSHVDYIGVPNGGYSGDKLWAFLEAEIVKNGKLPDYVRHSWGSVKKFLEQIGSHDDQGILS